ncbi:MAG: UvrB/UvrC motif-containing protein [Planctomycetes bacterium]|nr:UvrB/UvrC motif-containing protein [Planctomycetota bacterium]
MKSQCDKCGKPATVHLTEIVDGHKAEKHLCEECAVSEGIAFKTNLPISQLLEDFIRQTSQPEDDPVCQACGRRFSEFRQEGLLGCPNDYDAFGGQILAIIERAHDGSSQHVGKVPHAGAETQKKQTDMLRLKAQLKTAVAAEDYERAAAIRDQLKKLEQEQA